MAKAQQNALKKIAKQIEEARSHLLSVKEQDGILTSLIFKLERERQAIVKELSASMEITETEAPNAKMLWSIQDDQLLKDLLQKFLFTTAKRLGRSTMSIRFKVYHNIKPIVKERYNVN